MKKLFFSVIVLLLTCVVSLAQNKIDPELQAVLNQKSDEKISVNIIFKSQPDASELRQRSNVYADKETKRNIVIQELKNFSEKTQREVLSIIKSEESKGSVSDITCHWLSNSITCTTTKDVIERLAKRDDIMLIGYNCDRNALLGEVSAPAKSGKEITESVMQVHAPEVWDMGYTGEGVLVAILDTGVNYEHPDLTDHLWDGGEEYPNHGYNSYDDSELTMDNRGHGSHCAGIICGDGSGDKMTGIAPNATLMCIKALNDEGSATVNSICSGMEFAVEHGADVLSMSLGIKNSSISERTMLRHTCANTLEVGVIASVAAGNEGNSQSGSPVPNNIRVPGSCPAPWIHPDQQQNAGATSCVVSVGAADKNDKYATVSSCGPVTWQDTEFADYPYDPGIGLIRPDVCAPGVNVLSLSHNSEGYLKMTGTSMAAPCVAGVICLMLSKNPDLTPAEISMILETSATKISENKNNQTGSGRVDALAAINSIDMGNIVFKKRNFSDENGNNQINPNENISLDIDFENISEVTYSNIKAVLTCENELINITKAEIEIENIGANEIISVNEAFTFTTDANIASKTKIYFDVEFYENGILISKTRFNETIFDNTLKYAMMDFTVNEGNNEILDPGETALMRIFVNNEGNEIALGLKGALTSESNLIEISENEQQFSQDIAPASSTTVSFNITLSENAGSDFNIPLVLTITDKFGKTNKFDIDFISSCDVIYDLEDDFGDGWNGAKIIASYHEDEIVTEEYTVTNGFSDTFSRHVKTSTPIHLEWKKGGVDNECIYSINNFNGVEIYSGKGRQNGEFFVWSHDCSCQNKIMDVCGRVSDFKAVCKENSVSLSWKSPEEVPTHYEIYRDTELIGTTENCIFEDENPTDGSSYRYNVRPIYENCNGEFDLPQEVTFYENIGEATMPDVSIYPNPSKGIFTIRHDNIERVILYNVMGSKISDEMVNASEYIISDLKSGIYFVNIKTSNGSVIEKIVKY